MSGETDLDILLQSLSARLAEGVYVFVTLEDGAVPAGLHPRMMFREAEGTTLILLKSEAEAQGLAFEFPCRMITLEVHSSLAAVGFIARIASALARHGMGVNPVSGFYHDHLFVPEERAADAMRILSDIARGAGD
ncbi:ACT domain-containing protein [Ruegeria sp. WL0004]|uniref:ACT domain-containing protein n=1 Tax=Ruegeria marisflavi TaxID=2984152 RepID=A0ABT2WM08_9RHOB|nr:ACT domain-containing protein [Ruegeria sp. WL0004]MCU9836943.1 ACT domain-containing protein [Ruegeria sp. WL0004]